MNTDHWLEFKPKQYLSRQTAIELLGAQEKMIQELEREIRALKSMLKPSWLDE